MNKAFLKEPEQGAEYCPACKSLGQPVSHVTLDALVRLEFRKRLGSLACFCPFPTCEVAYFDAFERSVSVEALTQPIYPKSAQAPICACFGLTIEDVEADVAEGVVTRVKAAVARAKTPEAACQRNAANGQSCVSEIQKCFLRRRGMP